ncbi:MAG: hypothetical protein JSV84_09565 [Gemmatimonadota bacterium]|nr:MAG: hypothetical protein JSV84_09565 [Gemmatimonadota bacterium]
MRDLSKMLLFFFIMIPAISPAQYVVKEFSAPGPEARGLAWDGNYLWCVDADKDAIFRIDPASGDIVHSIPFDTPDTYGGGITWSGDGALWVSRLQYFYKLDTTTGRELAEFHCPGG